MDYEQSYSKKEAFELYQYYLAVKRHFTSNYDFFKYNGKVKVSETSFDTRKDKFSFYRLTRQHNAKDIILANLMVDPNMWIGKLVEPDKITIGKEFTKRKQSMTYSFKNDLSLLDDEYDQNLIVVDGQHPKIVSKYLAGQIDISTLIIIEDFSKCFQYWNDNISDPVIWPELNKKCENVKLFFEYDRKAMRKVLVDRFS